MKKSLILLVFLFGIFMLAGCKENVRQGEGYNVLSVADIADQDIEIKFVVRSGVISTALADLVAEFKLLYPKITVKIEALSGSYDTIRSTTMLDINSKKAPDLVIGYPDHFAEYFSAGALVNLQGFIESPDVGFTEVEMADFLETYLVENRGYNAELPEDLYGLPFNKSTEVLVYNKTFFEGVYGETWETKIPKTWQELETVGADIITRVQNKEADEIFVVSINPTTLVKTYLKVSDYLTTNKFIPLGYDSSDNAFITLTRQFGAAYTQRVDVENGYVRFNNAQTIAAMTYFKSLKDAKLFGTSALFGLDYMSDAFKLIQCVMTVGSSAGVGYNSDATSSFDYELGIAPIPYYAADKKFVIQQGTNVAMLNQNTDEEKLATWLFMKFLMQPEKTAQFAIATGGYLPVKVSAYETTEYAEFLTNPTDDKVNYSKAANVALDDYIEQQYIFFVDDAFVGSAAIRSEVGSVFNAIIVNNENIQARINQAYNTLKPYVEDNE
jgi:ABC-type glycerol-3-phosphate transport system substrate-binding protein